MGVNAWSAGLLIRSYDVTLPLGVEMTVNTVHWLDRRGNLDLLLTMHPEPEGQSGHCGNFNGDPNDDTLDMMRSMGSESPSEALGAEHPAEEAGWASEACAEAAAMCTALCGGREGGLAAGFTEDCIFDVCRAGPAVAVSDCLMAWQTRVVTTSVLPPTTKLVGPGCCRPVIDFITRMQNSTR